MQDSTPSARSSSPTQVNDVQSTVTLTLLAFAGWLLIADPKATPPSVPAATAKHKKHVTHARQPRSCEVTDKPMHTTIQNHIRNGLIPETR